EEGNRGVERRITLTRRHPGWPLSERYHAGLLHPSRPCPPRDHPPNGSIGPCLVIRPEADLALVARDSDPAQLVFALSPFGEWVRVERFVSLSHSLAPGNARAAFVASRNPGKTERRRRPGAGCRRDSGNACV